MTDRTFSRSTLSPNRLSRNRRSRSTTARNTLLQYGALLLLAAGLAACGGSSSSHRGGNNDGGGPPTDDTAFTDTASWTFQLPGNGGQLCFDFDTNTQVDDCTGTGWDVQVRSGGRSATFWTNSGTTHAAGQGGAFAGPFDYSWSALQDWQSGLTDGDGDGTTIPANLYVADGTSGVFVGDNGIQAAAFEYGIGGGHQLFPNYRVFLITTDSTDASNVSNGSTRVFAVQITGYYGGPSGTASGYPSLRWIERTDGASVQQETINASGGEWIHYDLVNQTVVDAPNASNWQIALNRYNIKLNGGESGDGTVAGYLGKTPAGFYDSEGQPIASAFLNSSPAATLADLTAADMATPANANAWVSDGTQSRLNAAYRGSHPAPLDFGWYTYYSQAADAQAVLGPDAAGHMLAANPENGGMIRSGTGDSYARFHVTNIQYADISDNSSAQTWTIEFDVQPAH